MKFGRLLSLILFLVVVLSACQFGEPATTSGPSSDPSSDQAGPYPAQDVAPPTLPPVLYPGAQDGDELYWDQIVGMINNGEVAKVVQTHDLKLFVTLKDGRSFTSTQPNIDEVLKVIEACGDICQDILVATE